MGLREQMLADLDNIFFTEEAGVESITLNGEETVGIPKFGTGEIRQVNAENRHEMAYWTLKKSEILRITGRSELQEGDIIGHDGKEWQYNSLTRSDGLVQKVYCICEESAVILR